MFAASREQIRYVWVAGECLVAEGRLTRMDEAALLERVADWGRRMRTV